MFTIRRLDDMSWHVLKVMLGSVMVQMGMMGMGQLVGMLGTSGSGMAWLGMLGWVMVRLGMCGSGMAWSGMLGMSGSGMVWWGMLGWWWVAPGRTLPKVQLPPTDTHPCHRRPHSCPTLSLQTISSTVSPAIASFFYAGNMSRSRFGRGSRWRGGAAAKS